MSTDLLPDFTDVDVPKDSQVKDEPPPSDYEYSCEICGVELFYAGKGRHPKRCADHKTRATGSRGSKQTGNETVARQAAAALSQAHGMICLGLMVPMMPMVGVNPLFLPETASALASADEGFTEAAYNALVTDPKLARMILKTGGVSGKLGLLIAYGMLASAVVPVGVAEFKVRGRVASRSQE